MFKKLREIRQNKNIKASEMAKEIGLKTEGAYYKKESGRVPFTLEEGKIVADMLDMPIDDIFFESQLSYKDNSSKKQRTHYGKGVNRNVSEP